jgi:hypothetical protein
VCIVPGGRAGLNRLVFSDRATVKLTSYQAATIDNCYLAHFVPDYTGTMSIQLFAYNTS